MNITISNQEGTTLAKMNFQEGQEYYAWETVKDFCKAYKGIFLEICVNYSEE